MSLLQEFKFFMALETPSIPKTMTAYPTVLKSLAHTHVQLPTATKFIVSALHPSTTYFTDQFSKFSPLACTCVPASTETEMSALERTGEKACPQILTVSGFPPSHQFQGSNC